MTPSRKKLTLVSASRAQKLANKNKINTLSIVILISLTTIVILVILGVRLAVHFRVFFPISSLAWEAQEIQAPELVDSTCLKEYAEYPGPDWPFPLLSPNELYYIEVSDAYFGKSKAMQLFRVESKQQLGTYYSSFSDLVIYCWAQDSSGVYISDYKPGGSGYGGIFTPHSEIGPVKKLLVPE